MLQPKFDISGAEYLVQPNILFTSLNDDISEAALRIVLISRVR
jgi:hypothetical protein